MSFSYDSSIPAADHNPSIDQSVMQTNAASIQSTLQVDHYAFQTGTDGQHKQVKFPSDVAQSAPALGAGVLYTQLVSTHAQLYFQNDNTTTQLTGPGVLQVRGGQGSFGSGVTTVTVSYTPFPTATLSCVASPFGSFTVLATDGSPTNSSFTVSRSSGSGTAAFSWIAVGN